MGLSDSGEGKAAAAVMDFKVPGAEFPRPFGNYLLLQSLARGGMGEVFLAKHGGIAGIEKYCVVKTLRGHYTLDREYVTRFIDEARVVVQLNHRNICQIFDVGRVGRKYFLAMEFIIGRDLRTIQQRLTTLQEDVGTDIALHVVGEVLEALDYAHRQRDPATGDRLELVHRDVSPQNIMVNFEGEVKLIDFGLAQSTQKVEKTQPHVVMGKMQYMSPEQARGDGVDGRADLFAAAVLTYEMVARERFYEGMSFDEVWQVAGRGGFRPRKFGELDPQLRSILDKALHADLGTRFATCADFREALMGYRYDNQLRASARTVREFMLRVFNEESDAHREMLVRYQNVSAIPAAKKDVEPEQSQSFAAARAGNDDASSVIPLRSDEATQGGEAASLEDVTRITSHPIHESDDDAQHVATALQGTPEMSTQPPMESAQGSASGEAGFLVAPVTEPPDAFAAVAVTAPENPSNSRKERTMRVRADEISNFSASVNEDDDVVAAFGPSKRPLWLLVGVIAVLVVVVIAIATFKFASGSGDDPAEHVVAANADATKNSDTGSENPGDQVAVVPAEPEADAPNTATPENGAVGVGEGEPSVAAPNNDEGATAQPEAAASSGDDPVDDENAAARQPDQATPQDDPTPTTRRPRTRTSAAKARAAKRKRQREEAAKKEAEKKQSERRAEKAPAVVVTVTYPSISTSEMTRAMTQSSPLAKRNFLVSKKCKARGASCAGPLVRNLKTALKKGGPDLVKWQANANKCIKTCTKY